MSLPELDTETRCLPPGIHRASFRELERAFGWNAHRRRLLAGLRRAIDDLRAARCHRIYVGGSFVTARDLPNDFDACWEAAGVDAAKLDPVFFEFANDRAAQKAKYGGELFAAHSPADRHGTAFIDFFQLRRHNPARKGIVAIDL